MSAAGRRRQERTVARGGHLEAARAAERRDGAAGALLADLRALADESTREAQSAWDGDRNWPAGHRVGDRWIGGAMNVGRLLWLSEAVLRPALVTGGVGSASSNEYLTEFVSQPGEGTFATITSGTGRQFIGSMALAFALADTCGWVTVGVKGAARGVLRGQPSTAWPELPGDVFEWDGPGPGRVHVPREVFERLLTLRRAGILKSEADAAGELEALVDARLAEANAAGPLGRGAPLSLPRAMRTLFYAMDPMSYDINSGDYAQRAVRPATTSVTVFHEGLRGKTVPVTVAVAVWDSDSRTITFDAAKADLEIPDRIGFSAPAPLSVAWPELEDIHLLNFRDPVRCAEVLRSWSAHPRRARARGDVVSWLRRRWQEGVSDPFEEEADA